MKVGNIKERCQSKILMLVVYFTTFFAPVQSEREGIGSLSFLNNRKVLEDEKQKLENMISFARLLQGKSVYLNSHMIFRISYGHLVARFAFMFFYEE